MNVNDYRQIFGIGTNRTKGIINSFIIMGKEIFNSLGQIQYKYHRIISEGEVNFVREFGIWYF